MNILAKLRKQLLLTFTQKANPFIFFFGLDIQLFYDNLIDPSVIFSTPQKFATLICGTKSVMYLFSNSHDAFHLAFMSSM